MTSVRSLAPGWLLVAWIVATSTSSAALDVVDQFNDPASATSFSGGVGSLMVQTFTPTRPTLRAVEIRLVPGGLFPTEGTSTTIRILHGGPDGDLVAESAAMIPGSPTSDVLVRFDFNATLTPLDTYAIEWEDPGATILTWRGRDDDPYAEGEAFISGSAVPARDLNFITYTAADFSQGLTAYWPLDGSVLDHASTIGALASTHDDDGSIVGSQGSFTFGSGKFDQAGTFDGVDGYVSVPTSPDLEHNGGPVSVSVWFRTDGFDVRWQAVVSKGESANYRIQRDNQFSSMEWAADGVLVQGGPAVDDGEWHHIVGISKDGSQEMWIDGSMVDDFLPHSQQYDNTMPLFIGNNPQTGGRIWAGEIDDLAIWERALTAGEVAQIYDSGTGAPIWRLVPEPSGALPAAIALATLAILSSIRRPD